jgi:hypothetical protein
MNNKAPLRLKKRNKATSSPAVDENGLWKVLIVDDEPAVHEVSEMILAKVQFRNRGLKLLSAFSAAQAKEGC